MKQPVQENRMEAGIKKDIVRQETEGRTQHVIMFSVVGPEGQIAVSLTRLWTRYKEAPFTASKAFDYSRWNEAPQPPRYDLSDNNTAPVSFMNTTGRTGKENSIS